MEKKIVESIVTCIISNLAMAHGGRSQYDWQTLGRALKGHLSQGNLQGADLEVVLEAAMEIELEYWGWTDFPAIQVAMIKAQIRDAILKK